MKTALLTLSAILSAACLLSHCTTSTSGEGRSLPTVTKDQPFVNSLGMKFVTVPRTNILMCTTETTVAQYQAAGLGYWAPQFNQSSNHPAVQVSWNNAKTWCDWLSRREGRKYRLPTDAEWSAAVGGSQFPWGSQWPPPNNSGNYAGQEMRTCTPAERAILWRGFNLIGGFSDRHKFTAPVGSYPANALGLYDLGGNVWEWCEDKHPTVSGTRVLRGGSWQDDPRGDLALSNYYVITPNSQFHLIGFRCVVGQ